MGSVIKTGVSGVNRRARHAAVVQFPALSRDIPEEARAADRPLQATAEGAEPEPQPEPSAGPDPEEEARAIVSAAEGRAREIVAAAQAEASSIEEAARATGYARGAEEAEARWAEALAQVAERDQAFQRECEAFFAAAEPELAHLSIDIARKVIKRELQQDEEAVLAVVRACMHRVKDKAARILVNPADLDVVRGARDSFLGIVDGMTDLEIVSDRRVGEGGCVLETPSGNLDARIETQLAYISEVFEKGTDARGDAD